MAPTDRSVTGSRTEQLSRPLLLFGGSGQVGRELQRALAPFGPIVFPTRAEADLERPDTVRAMIRRVQPSVVINCAALTNVDRSEREPELARALNDVAPGVMAVEACRLGAPIIHYSTDYVFDGAAWEPYGEEAPPNPINVYGMTKLAGERSVAAAGGPHLVIRTSWVYSLTGAGFVPTMLRQLREQREVRVVADQVGSPTWSRSLAAATGRLIGLLANGGELVVPQEDCGVYHLGGRGAASRAEIARELIAATRSSIDGELPVIIPISASEFAAVARRPAFSALANSRAERRFGIMLDDWRIALRHMLAEA